MVELSTPSAPFQTLAASLPPSRRTSCRFSKRRLLPPWPSLTVGESRGVLGISPLSTINQAQSRLGLVQPAEWMRPTSTDALLPLSQPVVACQYFSRIVDQQQCRSPGLKLAGKILPAPGIAK